jgi:dTDP-4-dehydrorhamnose 3,5-epimerase-like enzyme
MNMNLFIIQGKVRFVFYNLKKKSFLEIINSDKNSKRIFVPKKTWFAFQNLSSSESKILNFSNIVHDPKESQNEDLNFFSYKWKI